MDSRIKKELEKQYSNSKIPEFTYRMSDEEISTWCENGISRWRSLMPTKQKQKNLIKKYLKKKKMYSESVKHILCNNINKFYLGALILQ